jgi:hypothetical protein
MDIGLDVHKRTITSCVKDDGRQGSLARQDFRHAPRSGSLDEDAAATVERDPCSAAGSMIT